jgi:uncharacterized protein
VAFSEGKGHLSARFWCAVIPKMLQGDGMNPLQKITKGMRDLLAPPPAENEDVLLRVMNVTRGTELAARVEVASSGARRNKGLLGRDGLEPGGGLWIVPCESVHTFFMRFPIDLVYLDRHKKVKKVRHAVGAWRASVCLSAHSVLELGAGSVRGTGTVRGDVVEFQPVSSGSASS